MLTVAAGTSDSNVFGHAIHEIEHSYSYFQVEGLRVEAGVEKAMLAPQSPLQIHTDAKERRDLHSCGSSPPCWTWRGGSC